MIRKYTATYRRGFLLGTVISCHFDVAAISGFALRELAQFPGESHSFGFQHQRNFIVTPRRVSRSQIQHTKRLIPDVECEFAVRVDATNNFVQSATSL